jgi:hypothetical protein
MADVATLGLKVDASGALQGIGAVETKLQKLEASANQAGALISKAFLAGGAALGALGALVIKNTAEADAAFSQLEATVKSTGGVAGLTANQLRDTARGLQDLTTYSDEAVMGMQSILLTFTQIRGDQFNAASAAILNMSQLLGQDLKGAALQVGKALNDPVKGVAALAEAGIQFTDSQKDTLASMVAVGDIAGAQTVILKELETQFGGSAAAARNTMGGALMALRNAFGQLLEVPSIIAPVTVSLNAMVDVLKNPAVVQGVKTFVQDTVFLLGSLAQAFLELTAVAIDTVGGLARLFGKLSPASSPLNKAADAADRWSASLVNTAYAIDGIQTRIAEFTPSVTKAGKAVAVATPEVETLTKAVTLQKEEVSEGAKAWYEFFKSLENTNELQQLPIVLTNVAESALPPEQAQGAWRDFMGWLSTEAQFATENIGSAFAQTFQNIAARGKATMADVFSTIGSMFKAGSAGSGIFAAVAVMASVVEGALAGRSDEVEQAKATREQFQKEITAFNEMLSRWATDIGGYATDLDAAIASVNRTFDDQARQLRDIFDAANQTYNVDTAKNLDAYNKAYAALVKLRDDEIKRITELNEKKKAEFAEDMAIRSLLVAGLNDQAELVRQEIAQAKELAEAKRLGIDTTELEILQLQERNKLLERQERERGFTISGLDAAIAREGGDSDLADQIERDIERQRILAEVTDATIKAKYEELWALEDTNRAAREAAEAIQLLADQAAISEDLEVRKLMATGKTMEAEELRFQLEQKRELARAEADFASGLITQDILDQLREVLGLEADAFANRNQQTGESTTFGGASNSATRSGGTQAIGSFAGAQVQDIDRVVGELTTIRVRAGQLVQLMTALVRGGGILGVVNAGIQGQTQNQSLLNGNLVVS